MSKTFDIKLANAALGGDGASCLSFPEIDKALADASTVMSIVKATTSDLYGETFVEMRANGTYAATLCHTKKPTPMAHFGAISSFLSAIESVATSPSPESQASLNSAREGVSSISESALDLAIADTAGAKRKEINFEINGASFTFNVPHQAHIRSYLGGNDPMQPPEADREVVVTGMNDALDLRFTDGSAVLVEKPDDLPLLMTGTQLTLGLGKQKEFLVVTQTRDTPDE